MVVFVLFGSLSLLSSSASRCCGWRLLVVGFVSVSSSPSASCRLFLASLCCCWHIGVVAVLSSAAAVFLLVAATAGFGASSSLLLSAFCHLCWLPYCNPQQRRPSSWLILSALAPHCCCRRRRLVVGGGVSLSSAASLCCRCPRIHIVVVGVSSSILSRRCWRRRLIML